MKHLFFHDNSEKHEEKSIDSMKDMFFKHEKAKPKEIQDFREKFKDITKEPESNVTSDFDSMKDLFFKEDANSTDLDVLKKLQEKTNETSVD